MSLAYAHATLDLWQAQGRMIALQGHAVPLGDNCGPLSLPAFPVRADSSNELVQT